MKPAEVRKQIAAAETGPLYLLEGDDPQSRHDVALEFAAIVDEGLHAFNVQSFSANDVTSAGARDQLIGDLLAAARTLPMMAPRRVLLVHAAERLLSPRRGGDAEEEPEAAAAAGSKRKKAATPAEELEAYFAEPEKLTTLVFVAGQLDANRRLVKVLRKHAISVDCGTLEDSRSAVQWIKERFEKESMTIEPQAAALLVESTGLHLARIRADVEKLALYAAGEPIVTTQHVREIVVPQDDSSEHFALANAIRALNARNALRELTLLLDANTPEFLILGQIRSALRPGRPGYGLTDRQVRAAMDAVLETNLGMTSSVAEKRFLLERLVIEVCSAR